MEIAGPKKQPNIFDFFLGLAGQQRAMCRAIGLFGRQATSWEPPKTLQTGRPKTIWGPRARKCSKKHGKEWYIAGRGG